MDEAELNSALKYLHTTGHLVLLGDTVCAKAQVIVKMAAEFISPEEVRNRVLMERNNDVSLLEAKDIGVVLKIAKVGSPYVFIMFFFILLFIFL